MTDGGIVAAPLPPAPMAGQWPRTVAQPRHLSDLREPPAALPVTVHFAGQLVTMLSPRAELLQATTQQN